MDLLNLFVRINAKDEATEEVDGIGNKITGALGGAAKVAGTAMAAITGAAVAGAGAIGKAALDSYAEYEQLAGGAELLFGEAYGFIEQRSQEAFRNVQMSQNDYLQQANGFAVGLRESMGGNIQAAAELADRIITAEADVIAATGNSAESVQNAFNGLMRGNYMMLDNLGLGVKGTKEGMQEVIDKVNEWHAAQGEASNYTIDSIADTQQALVDYIEMVGMSGYASAEAAGTIQGSMASLSAAWDNFLTDLAKEDGDIGARIGELMESVNNVLFGDEGVGGIVPRIQTVVENVAEAIPQYLPNILTALQGFAEPLLGAVVTMAPALIEGAMQAIMMLSEALPGIITQLLPVIISMLPQMVEAGITLFLGLAKALTEAGPETMAALTNALADIIALVVRNAPQMLGAAVQLFIAIVAGIASALPDIIRGVGEMVSDMVDYVIEHGPEMLAAAGEFILNLANGIGNAGGDILNAIGDVVSGAVEKAKSFFGDMLGAGENLIQGLIDGVANMARGLADKAMSVVSGAVAGVKGFLGIASPSKLFRKFGQNTMEGFALGIDDQAKAAEDAMLNAMKDVEAAARADVSFGGYGIAKSDAWGRSGGDVYNISIDAANPQDFEAMAMEFVNAVEARKRTAGKASKMNVRVV